MVTYIVLLCILLLFWIISNCYPRSSSYLFYLGIIILIIIASFKDTSVGTDTLVYYDNFLFIQQYQDLRTYSGPQRIWYYINLMFNSINNYTLFMIFCYSISYGGIGYLINKQSKDRILSLILFFLFFFGASLNIMRQYIAIGVFCIALYFLSNKNYYKYIIITIIASFFHFSTLLMIFLPIIQFINFSKTKFIILVISSFIIGFFLNIMNPIVMSLSFLMSLNEGAQGYLDSWGGERNLITNLIINLVFIISLYASKNRQSLYIKMWLFFILLSNLFGASPQGNRIFIYLFIGMIIAIPIIFKELYYPFNKILYLSIILIYGIGYWYIVLSSGQNEIIPYQIRL